MLTHDISIRKMLIDSFILFCYFFSWKLVIGGWDNTRVLLRKKKNAETLKEVFESNIVNLNRPTKVILEVANSELDRHISFSFDFPH